MPLPTLAPLNMTGISSFDFGDMQSPDGRAHIVDANTPVQVVQNDPRTPAQMAQDAISPKLPSNGVASAIAGYVLPAHFGARMAVGVLALGILIVVAVRITFAPEI